MHAKICRFTVITNTCTRFNYQDCWAVWYCSANRSCLKKH